MRLTLRVVLLSTAIVLTGVPASAQNWSERVFISVNGAFQVTKNSFDDRFTFELNQETGSTDVDYPGDGGFVFDAGAGYRLVKNFGVGGSFSYFTHEGTAQTTSSFPHPFFFNQPREVTGETAVTRTETAIHIQAMYLWDPSGPLRLVLSGGPSFFTVEQELVTQVRITESFPYDTATFASADTRREKGSAPAFNIGADVFWMFTPQFGVGGLVRFSRASVDLDTADNRAVSVDAGGAYVGGGVRIVF
jgi:hypothetical protein